ncbi:ankyrin repeats (3 copies) family protein [Aspergillus tubingensis]|uniref:ankyrin repeats (3 copies) family protein n=1 Tax=Aspergillus tubingensis TaxID=5068 RepID=UPI001578B5FC|nr:ankyrin repeats (3 copies) family protein [Aspergillus tubingensis]GFN17054.1 ankyrin repeats (3 copies) family protein [Aspergillus tubingensis]
MSPRWFGQEEVSPGIVIELEKRWRVLSQKEEHQFQGSEQDDPRWSGPSYACIQLKVKQVGSRITPPVNGYMRIYKQIPTEETVADRPEIRAQQAKIVVPPELRAYRQLMDKDSTFTPRLLDSMEQKQGIYSFVLGGYVVWIVTEEVPGIRLGNSIGNETFWVMKPCVRDEIRLSFKEAYL